MSKLEYFNQTTNLETTAQCYELQVLACSNVNQRILIHQRSLSHPESHTKQEEINRSYISSTNMSTTFILKTERNPLHLGEEEQKKKDEQV